MSICIIDPARYMPGLKLLIPEADYYIPYEPDFFKMSNVSFDEFKKRYNIPYSTNMYNINPFNYDYVIIVFATLYGVEGNNQTKPMGVRMLNYILDLIKKHKFKKVILFDVYDYDYDPSLLIKDNVIDIFFKRNYNKHKKYNSNVYPFPCSMFVTPCVISMMINKSIENSNQKRKNAIFWSGSLYMFEDKEFGIVRSRTDIYNKISNYIDSYPFINYPDYIRTIQNYKICLDLQGNGDPNKRTFEVLSNGSLLFTNICDLDWGFEDGDAFSDETIFTDENDFIPKSQILLNNDDIYKKCLDNQNYLVEKYFTKEYMRQTILNKLIK